MRIYPEHYTFAPARRRLKFFGVDVNQARGPTA